MCFSIIYQVFYTVSGNNPFLRVFALGEDVFSFSILEFLQSLVVFRAITTIEKLGGGIHPQLGTQGLSHYDGGAYYFMEVITIVPSANEVIADSGSLDCSGSHSGSNIPSM